MKKKGGGALKLKEEGEAEYLALGKISGPWGLKGELKAKLFNASSSFPKKVRSVRLKAGLSFEEFAVEDVRPHGAHFLLKLKGFDSPEAARSLKGRELFVPLNILSKKNPGEHYVFELSGMEVVTSQGLSLGLVKEVVNYGASEILVVRSQGKPEILIPLVPDILKEVLKEEGKIVIEPMEGLF